MVVWLENRQKDAWFLTLWLTGLEDRQKDIWFLTPWLTGLEDRQKDTWFLTPWLTGLEKECRKLRLALCVVGTTAASKGSNSSRLWNLVNFFLWWKNSVCDRYFSGCVSLLDFSREFYATITLFLLYWQDIVFDVLTRHVFVVLTTTLFSLCWQLNCFRGIDHNVVFVVLKTAKKDASKQ